MRFQLKREWVIPTVVGVVSFVAGTGTGYAIKRYRDQRFGDFISAEKESVVSDADKESESVQLRFELDDTRRDFNQAIQEVTHVIRQLKERGSVFLADLEADGLNESRDSHPSNGETNVVNIFPVEDDEWDYDVEVPLRTPDRPYIIHVDEYMDKEEDNRQSTLTYYEGDQILCDEHDTPVYDAENIIGKPIFGHGSKDPNICYIRNERLMAEYEILRDSGFYQVQVLGEELEERDLKHSKHLSKFRME